MVVVVPADNTLYVLLEVPVAPGLGHLRPVLVELLIALGAVALGLVVLQACRRQLLDTLLVLLARVVLEPDIHGRLVEILEIRVRVLPVELLAGLVVVFLRVLENLLDSLFVSVAVPFRADSELRFELVARILFV